MTHKKLLERNRKITDALQNGAKVTDLAQEHGLSPQTVYHIAQAEMEKRRKVTFTEWKDNRNDEIRNQYQEGISAEELAKAFNLNRATIFRILKEGGDSYTGTSTRKSRPLLCAALKISSRGLWTTRRRTPTRRSRTLLGNTVSVPLPDSSIFMRPVSIAARDAKRRQQSLRGEPV
jgi:Mor family transcriptional regulator